MLHRLSQDDFKTRVKAINRSLKWLARASGNDPMTAYRGPKRFESYGRQHDALVAEEKRLLAHLIGLHGCTVIAPLPPEAMAGAPRLPARQEVSA